MVSAIMRALGDSKTPLYFLVLTSAVNIVLDLVLIINFDMVVWVPLWQPMFRRQSPV